jgi:hypothetical protein
MKTLLKFVINVLSILDLSDLVASWIRSYFVHTGSTQVLFSRVGLASENGHVARIIAL